MYFWAVGGVVNSCLMFDCLAANVWLSVTLMIDQTIKPSMDLSQGRNHVSFEEDENKAVRNGIMNCGWKAWVGKQK